MVCPAKTRRHQALLSLVICGGPAFASRSRFTGQIQRATKRLETWATLLDLLLALDAHSCERQCFKAIHADGYITFFTYPVCSLLETTFRFAYLKERILLGAEYAQSRIPVKIVGAIVTRYVVLLGIQ